MKKATRSDKIDTLLTGVRALQEQRIAKLLLETLDSLPAQLPLPRVLHVDEDSVQLVWEKNTSRVLVTLQAPTRVQITAGKGGRILRLMNYLAATPKDLCSEVTVGLA